MEFETMMKWLEDLTRLRTAYRLLSAVFYAFPPYELAQLLEHKTGDSKLSNELDDFFGIDDSE